MRYSEFVSLYDSLAATTKRLEKAAIVCNFLKELSKEKKPELIYLLQGKVVPEYDVREFGISTQLVMKALHVSFGISEEEVQREYSKTGDFGEITMKFAEKRKQGTLFKGKALSAEKVYDSLRLLFDIEGKGTVEKKLAVISEVFSLSTPLESKYIVRTILSDLKVGVADSILLDAINSAFFDGREEERVLLEEKNDLANDLAKIFAAAASGREKLEKISLTPGIPVKVMLPVKVDTIEECFEVCGKPAAFEHKYDGFRVLINKDKDKVSLFTRKLENVTNQFPDVVSIVKSNIKGESFVLDSEIVGYETKTGKHLPFEAISQRIRRKYDIKELIEKLPVEINVFDVLFHDGESVIDWPFMKRRELVEKIIKEKKLAIKVSEQIITDDLETAQKFYDSVVDKGEEGIMIKKIDAPYKQGRRVGYIAKMKPVANDLDLVIVGAENGTGKRGGWLTSYIVACRDGDKFVEVGRVSSGLKEKEEEGFTFENMTQLLRPLVINQKGNVVSVKPKIVVSVTYQNVQPSPSYSSGYALRFPRISHYRPDRKTGDIATVEDIERALKASQK